MVHNFISLCELVKINYYTYCKRISQALFNTFSGGFPKIEFLIYFRYRYYSTFRFLFNDTYEVFNSHFVFKFFYQNKIIRRISACSTEKFQIFLTMSKKFRNHGRFYQFVLKRLYRIFSLVTPFPTCMKGLRASTDLFSLVGIGALFTKPYARSYLQLKPKKHC